MLGLHKRNVTFPFTSTSRVRERKLSPVYSCCWTERSHYCLLHPAGRTFRLMLEGPIFHCCLVFHGTAANCFPRWRTRPLRVQVGGVMDWLPSAGSLVEKSAGKLLVLISLVRWEICSALLQTRKSSQRHQPGMKTVALQRSGIFNFSLRFPLSKPQSDNDWHAAVHMVINEIVMLVNAGKDSCR